MHYGVYNIYWMKTKNNNSIETGGWREGFCFMCEVVWYHLKVVCVELKVYIVNPKATPYHTKENNQI